MGNSPKLSTTKAEIIGFQLLKGFPLGALAAALEALRGANDISRQAAFEFHTVSESGALIRSSAGLEIATQKLSEIEAKLDYLFIIGSGDAQFDSFAYMRALLNKRLRFGKAIGAISGGVFPLARTGLLNARNCSVHWYFKTAFVEEFPDTLPSDNLFVIDGNILTASGGAAAFDLMAHLISRKLDHHIGLEVSRWFQYHRIRDETETQLTQSDNMPICYSPWVEQAIDLFQNNIETPLPLQDIAKALGISLRQLERLFKTHMGCSPAAYYRNIRTARAREYVLHTNMSLSGIAVASGFSSASQLTRIYRAQYGISPSLERRTPR